VASPLDETIHHFVEDVFSNETLLPSERKQYILSAMLLLESKIENRTHRWGMSMTLSNLGKEAKRLRNKGGTPEGEETN
jgi:hypothetical protein